MPLLGTVLKNRRAGQAQLAWNQPNLAGQETLTLTSVAFAEGGAIPAENAGKRAGGSNVSPALAWSTLPPATAQLLLVIEDIDAPTSRPFVHCVALVDPAELAASAGGLPAGALSAQAPGPGVRLLRSGMGRGYLGPEPIKGHGAHHYVFQLFALSAAPADSGLDTAKARAVLASVSSQVLARGRLTGTYER
jgi:Raf kinase inhibitor-like YbhB/YbcL family protein